MRATNLANWTKHLEIIKRKIKVGDLVKHVRHDTFLPELSCGVVVGYKKELDLYKIFWYTLNRVETDNKLELEIISESRRFGHSPRLG